MSSLHHPQPPKAHDHHDHDHDDHGHAHSHADHGADACCGSQSVEAVAAPLPLPLGDGTRTAIRILQMDCPTEEALLRKKLGGMDGVSGMEFNLMQRVLTVEHTPPAIAPILEAIRSLDFNPEVATGTQAQSQPTPEPASSASTANCTGEPSIFLYCGV